MELQHTQAIISDAYNGAKEQLKSSDMAKKAVIERELEVLERIDTHYNLGALSKKSKSTKIFLPSSYNLPDKEIGYLGERYVYDKEIEYMKSIGEEAKKVEWISQSVPNSPFDIKTIRREKNGSIREYFLEVKSSTSMNESDNIYVSSQQFEFAEAHDNEFSFVLVSFDKDRKPVEKTELTLKQLLKIYDKVPIKFRLKKGVSFTTNKYPQIPSPF